MKTNQSYSDNYKKLDVPFSKGEYVLNNFPTYNVKTVFGLNIDATQKYVRPNLGGRYSRKYVSDDAAKSYTQMANN
jgi:hypothetical protein